jgi:hypothetical protein
MRTQRAIPVEMTGVFTQAAMDRRAAGRPRRHTSGQDAEPERLGGDGQLAVLCRQVQVGRRRAHGKRARQVQRIERSDERGKGVCSPGPDPLVELDDGERIDDLEHIRADPSEHRVVQPGG